MMLGKSPMMVLPPALTKSTELGGILEARGGIEPPDKGFAGLCLTTWLPRRTFWLKVKFLEARDGVEPTMEVLQTSALPLGYRA